MNNHNFDEFQFEDAETYRGGYDDKISFKMIVLMQLKKIGQNANCEFRGGYWQEKAVPLPNGQMKITEEYIPDTREIYSNSIEYLHDILRPHFKMNKKVRVASDKAKEELKKLMEQYMKDGKFTEQEKLEFRDKRIVICRELFVALNGFLEDVNYFGERSN